MAETFWGLEMSERSARNSYCICTGVWLWCMVMVYDFGVRYGVYNDEFFIQ